MKKLASKNNDAMNAALTSVLNRVEKTAFDESKKSLQIIASQKNAYTCEPPEAKWNMITYKKGQKSDL